jgi:hypothetical protein
MTEKLATKLFRSWQRWQKYEDEFYSEIEKIVGEQNWSLVDELTFDQYDCSMEFLNCKPGFEINKLQEQKIFKLGFQQFWICYGTRKQKFDNDVNYSEKYFYNK